MASGGKGGGGKGIGQKGGGKVPGGKGKKGGGCAPGDIVILSGLSANLYHAVKDAFDNPVTSAGGTQFTVRLECSVAERLVFVVATSIENNFVRKKPKGKKGGK